jgi:hypothetical protein
MSKKGTSMNYKNIVYIIEFVTRKANNIEPYYYIGSKSKCFFDGIDLITSAGKLYFGSSKAKGYTEALKSSEIKIHILASFDNYEDCISAETYYHILNDVVADTRFWNLSYAATNSFSNPEYVTVRNTRTGKTVRLPKTHEKILSGEYVGVTSGMHYYTNGYEDKLCLDKDAPEGWSRCKSNTQNLKRGDDHYMRKNPISKEDFMKRIEKRKQNMKEFPELYEEGKLNQRRVASLTNKGVAKSKESNEKRSVSNKNYVSLKNKITGECVRIKKDLAEQLDPNIWQNPYKLADKCLGAKWYNDGNTEKKFFPEEPIPENFTKGRIKRNKS